MSIFPIQLLWLVIQIWLQPSLYFSHFHFISPRVIFDLISPDLAEGEIFRFRVREIQAADRTGRRHRERFSQMNARVLFGLQQIEERSFLGVIWLRRIAGSGPDAAITFFDQIL